VGCGGGASGFGGGASGFGGGGGWARAAGANSNAGRPAAHVSLCCDDHVVEGAHRHSQTGPLAEVVCGGNGSTSSLRLTNTPVLLEGRGTLNGRFIGAGGNVDVIHATIGGDGAFHRSGAARWCEGTVIFDDVEFDERVCRPAVDRQI